VELWWIPVVVVVAILLAALAVLRVSRRRGGTTERLVPRTRPVPAEAPPPRRTEALGARIRSLFGGAVDDPWARLEELLVKADVGPSTAGRVVAAVRDRYTSGSDPVELVSDEVAEILAGDGALDLPE
jgi:hypothetical protein